jgi:hypothetical protein
VPRVTFPADSLATAVGRKIKDRWMSPARAFLVDAVTGAPAPGRIAVVLYAFPVPVGSIGARS